MRGIHYFYLLASHKICETEIIINVENEREAVVENDVNEGEILSSRKAGEDPEPVINGEATGFAEVEDQLEVTPDYSSFTKKDFVDVVKELAREEDIRKADRVLRQIKPFYEELRERDRLEALAKFVNLGGIPEDFEFKADAWDVAFDASARLIRDKRTSFHKQQESEKAANLAKKTALLESLRALVDTEDNEHSLLQLKKIQQEWKQVGAVPQGDVKNLWANYTALLDLFYDHRSIYFELKELDRKKNLEAKFELCNKAEALLQLANLKDAIRELNGLHNEFKHIGPVPKEDKESVWQRFKATSDAIYERRDNYVTQLQQELHKNLEEKEKVCEEVAAFQQFQSDRIKVWNQKTQEILEVQKKWQAIGGVPRSKTKELNKKFWSAFKAFFNNKNSFFKKLDDEREKNLQLKNEIVKQAQELKESQDWDKTANQLKALQKKWQEAGPVPEKLREKVFKEFKEACDYFFEQRRQQLTAKDQEQEGALRQKEAICQELEQAAADKTGSPEQLNKLQERYHAIGFVPKASVTSIKQRFSKAIENYLTSLPVSEEERDRLMLEMQLKEMKDDPQAERKIFHREQAIKKRISKVENDIAVLRNNLEFFGRSKNAEKMKSEFSLKIEEADEQLAQLRKQLKLLKTVS